MDSTPPICSLSHSAYIAHILSNHFKVGVFPCQARLISQSLSRDQSPRREVGLVRRGDSVQDSESFPSPLVERPGREASPQGGHRLPPSPWVLRRGRRSADGLGGAPAEEPVIGRVWNGFGSGGRLGLLPNGPGRQPSPQGRPCRRQELPDGLDVGRLGLLPVRAVSTCFRLKLRSGGRGERGGALARWTSNYLAGLWLVSARLWCGRLFSFGAWPGLDYSCGPWPPGVIVRVILRAHVL